jgi:hypothetical protein
MINNINNNQIEGLIGNSSFKHNSRPKASPNSNLDASLQVNYASLINKAMQPPKDDADSIQKAHELLLSGQLEKPENFIAAAKDIEESGI